MSDNSDETGSYPFTEGQIPWVHTNENFLDMILLGYTHTFNAGGKDGLSLFHIAIYNTNSQKTTLLCPVESRRDSRE